MWGRHGQCNIISFNGVQHKISLCAFLRIINKHLSGAERRHSSWTALTFSTEGGADCGRSPSPSDTELSSSIACCSSACCVAATRRWQALLAVRCCSATVWSWWVVYPMGSVEWATSTLASQCASWSRPAMQASSMSSNQNSRCSCWLPTDRLTCVFPLMPIFWPVTDLSWVLVGSYFVFSRVSGRTSEMVAPVSTSSQQGCPSSLQCR